MGKSGIWKKRLAAVTTVCLAAGSIAGLSGCGNSDVTAKAEEPGDSNTESIETENTSTETAEKEDADNQKGMGRYLEEDVNLPEDCKSLYGIQTLEDGKLRIFYATAEKNIMIADSGDGGASWQGGAPINEKLGINLDGGGVTNMPAPAISEKGDIFFCVYVQEDENSEGMSVYYHMSADGEVHKLDFSGLSENFYVFNCKFTEQGTLLLQTVESLIEVNPEDGSKLYEYENGNRVEFFGVAGNKLAVVVDGSVHYYNTETKEPIEGGDVLTEQMASNPENLMLMSTSSLPILFCKGDEEDAVFYADHKGLYRYAFGGNVVEQVIDASLNSMGSPATSFLSLSRDKEGVFYLLYRDGNDGLNVLKYVYSKDTPAVPDTELKLYSLKDNSFIKQVAAIFQKKYPDIYLNIETGMSGDDAITSTDAIKTLNTEIMAGKGPDIMILDGISENTYIEKGMLADLSGLLKDAGILDNVKEAYTQEDGSIYCMPSKFGIPMIMGKKDEVSSVNDLKSMADILEAHLDEYNIDKQPMSFARSASYLLGALAEVSYPAWLDEQGVLDETAVREYLEQVNRIYQSEKNSVKEMIEQYGMSEADMDYPYSREYSRVSSNAMSMKYGMEILGPGLLLSPEDFARVYSAEKDEPSLSHALWNGQSENCFTPLMVAGISAKSTQKEAAEKFIQFLFSGEGQKISSYSGLPVNETVFDSMDYWNLGGENGVISESSSSNSETGEKMVLTTIQPPEDAISEVQKLGKTLTQPVAFNEIILNAVMSSGARYLKGDISLDEACNSITQEVNLYLSE